MGLILTTINFTLCMFVELCVRMKVLLPRQNVDESTHHDPKFIAAFALDALFRFTLMTFSVFQLAMLGSAGVTYCSAGESLTAHKYQEDVDWTQAMAVT